MPIKGLTDNVLPAFPRLGKLRKGGAKPATGFGYGKDLEYFRFTSERDEVLRVFTQAYGEQPALLNVYLPYAGLEDNWQAWLEEWSAGGLVHRCDGETMTIWRTATGYSQKPEPCPWRTKERTTKNPGCKPVGRLTVVIPELIRAGFVGYVTLETHSKHDLLSIQATLLAVIEARSGVAAGLRGIPFVLRRVPETISTPDADGKRVSREKWLIKLEPAADWVSLQLETAQRAALAGRQPLQLTSGKIVDQRTGEVLDAPDDDDDVVEPVAVTAVTTATAADDAPVAGTVVGATTATTATAVVPPVTVPPVTTATAFVPPVCPKCSGPMWDNRAKREQAKAEGKPKPPPAWACKNGKYDPETRQRTGCDGVIWPSDPNEEDGQGKPPAPGKPAADTITTVIDLAVKLYRTEAGATMKAWLNDSYGVVGPSLKVTLQQLTPEQLRVVLTKLRKAETDQQNAAGEEVAGWGTDRESA